MKKLVLVCLLTSLTPLFSAEEYSIKITSFGRVSNNIQNLTAEVCGYITGPVLNNIRIELISDYQNKNAGYYQTATAANGQFCDLISTFTGKVRARIKTQSQSDVLVDAQIK